MGGQVLSAPSSARVPVAAPSVLTPGRSGSTPSLVLEVPAGGGSHPGSRPGSATYPPGASFDTSVSLGTLGTSGSMVQVTPRRAVAVPQLSLPPSLPMVAATARSQPPRFG